MAEMTFATLVPEDGDTDVMLLQKIAAALAGGVTHYLDAASYTVAEGAAGELGTLLATELGDNPTVAQIILINLGPETMTLSGGGTETLAPADTLVLTLAALLERSYTMSDANLGDSTLKAFFIR